MSNTASPSAGSAASSPSSGQLYGRVCELLVSNSAGQALDLSALRIKFVIKKTGVMTPNAADIYVYNLSDQTANQIINKEFTKVILNAGYVGNNGLIFSGNIKWATKGRESATDTFVNLVCGTGDGAYNYAVVNQSIPAGSTPQVRLQAALAQFNAMGVKTSSITGTLPVISLPRGKVMYGNARDYIRTIADTHGFSWSIQDEGIVFISQKTYLPGTVVSLNSANGMVGAPTQTIEGIMVKSLLNPSYKVNGRVQINNASIQKFKIDPLVPGSVANTPAFLSADGVYYILACEHSGDTRGRDWYSSLQTLSVAVTANPRNSISTGVGT